MTSDQNKVYVPNKNLVLYLSNTMGVGIQIRSVQISVTKVNYYMVKCY